MPLFTYRCGNGHEWDERRDRNDPNLQDGQRRCTICYVEHGILATGQKVFLGGGAPAVYYHGSGWAAKDRYWEKVDAEQ